MNNHDTEAQQNLGRTRGEAASTHAALAHALGVGGVTFPETYDTVRRRGRPTVPESDRHRPVALSLPPDITIMLKDDAALNNQSASAYVARLIRSAHDTVRERDPLEFYATVTMKLNAVGAQVDLIGSRSFTLSDLVRLPMASVQVKHDLGTLWVDTIQIPDGATNAIHLYFQWVKVWDGKRYERHFRREIDMTFWTEAAVIDFIMLGGSSTVPDVL